MPRDAVAARPAATVLVVRDCPFEVLMVERHAETIFASALVFPGGLVDAGDHAEEWLPLLAGGRHLPAEERALRIAAVRETFEEAGLLLSAGGPVPVDGGDRARPFRELVQTIGAGLDLEQLVKVGHWITPAEAPRRFDTHFYLAHVPEGTGGHATCDGRETVSLEWLAPAGALALAAEGRREILFPTRMNLKRLAQSSSGAEAVARAAADPPVTVQPVVERTADGMRVRIPAAAGYGGEIIEQWTPMAPPAR
jgi:8-oxo-dGTP pyrophosphatase MutT (NUDIX family)